MSFPPTGGFNPHEPCVIGLEWRPVREFEGLCMGLDQNVVGFLLDSTAVETIDSLAVFVTEALADSRGFVCEVYPIDEVTPHTQSVLEFVPSLTTASVNMTGYNDGGAVPGELADLLQDDPSTWVEGLFTFPSGQQILVPDATFIMSSDGNPASIQFKYTDVIADLPATAFVQSVEFEFHGQTLLGASDAQAATLAAPVLSRLGVPFQGDQRFMSALVVEAGQAWPVDPLTGQLWTVDTVGHLDALSGAPDSLGVKFLTFGGAEVFTIMGDCRLVVRYVDPDPRVAFGFFDDRVLAPGWRSVTFQQPDGTPGWPKTVDTFLVLFRRYANNGRTLKVRALGYNADGDYASAPTALTGTVLTFDEAHLPDTAEATRTNAMAAVMVTDGSEPSVDSQPYASADGDTEWVSIGSDPNSFWSGISANDTGEQDITAHDGGDYQYLRFIARADLNEAPTDPLTVTVKRRSDDVTILGPVDFDPEDLSAPFDTWQLLDHLFDAAATVAAGVQLYVTFESDVSSTASWHVQALSTLSQLPAGYGPPTDTDQTNYGGETDVGTWRTVARDQMDYAVILCELPDPVTGLDADQSEPAACTTEVVLTWEEAAALTCGLFGGYEIERRPETAEDWALIGIVWDQDVATFTDLEPPRNSPTVGYRIRQRRIDGAPSLWSDPVEIATADDCCGYRISSNAAGVSLWFDDVGNRTYTVIDRTTFVSYELEDFQAAFQELVERGDTFPVTLLVAADGSPQTAPADPVGRGAFQPLLVLLGSQRDTTGALTVVPHLCVADETGQVWYAAVKPTGPATREGIGGAHLLVVTVTEIAAVPVPLEIGTPPDPVLGYG